MKDPSSLSQGNLHLAATEKSKFKELSLSIGTDRLTKSKWYKVEILKRLVPSKEAQWWSSPCLPMKRIDTISKARFLKWAKNIKSQKNHQWWTQKQILVAKHSEISYQVTIYSEEVVKIGKKSTPFAFRATASANLTKPSTRVNKFLSTKLLHSSLVELYRLLAQVNQIILSLQ